MTVNYTTLLGLAKPVSGTESGTWGDTVNTNLTDYLDSAVAGAQIISGTQTAVTLSKTTGASLSQAGLSGITGSSQYQIIRCTGNPSSLLTITAPATDKTYVIINATSPSQSVKIVSAGPTTGVTILSGKTSLVAWNGSDFVEVSPNTISGVLPVANGGTGATSAATARTNLGATTVGGNVFTLTNPSAITFPRFNADNTVSALNAADFRTAIGAGAGSVTSVAMSVPTFLTVTGSPITGAGTLAVTLSGTALPVANGGTGVTTSTGSGNVVLSTSPTITTPTLTGYTESVVTLATSGSIAFSVTSGTTQSCAAAGTVTFTDSLSSGQSISLLLTNGSSYTINWPAGTTWVTAAGNTAPTLSASNTLVFWKISSTLYGALVGKSA